VSYRELEFHPQDSEAFRAFVGLGFEEKPSFQTLQGEREADPLGDLGGDP
jgi:hypothetical protein